MTNQEINEKAKALSESRGKPVEAFTFYGEDETDLVVGFIETPSRRIKLLVADKMMSSPMTAGAELLDMCLIKEESDARIYTEKPENDQFYLGAIQEVLNTVRVSQNQLKKK